MSCNSKRDKLFRSNQFRIENYNAGGIVSGVVFLGSDGRVLVDSNNDGNLKELEGKLSLQFNTGFKDEKGNPIFAHDKVIDKSSDSQKEGYIFNIYGEWVACFDGEAPSPLNECACYLEVVGGSRFSGESIEDRCLSILSNIHEVLYGKNIDIAGWHLNGDLESFDNFADNEGWFDILGEVAKDEEK